MRYLTNLTTKDIARWFDNDWTEVEKFIVRNQLNGIELMLSDQSKIEKIDETCVLGMHLKYWPIWLDFWQGNRTALMEQFGNLKDIELFYGGLDKRALVEYYKREWEIAQLIGAEYVVVHVAHVELLHTYTWEFGYSDWDVLEATCELVNQSFGSNDRGIKLLFENLWWPGLKLTDPALAKKFLDKVDYANKGFMLDIGHLMVTNPQIRNEEEACDYICSTIDKLEDLKSYIKGIHLNKSLSGEYLRKDHGKDLRNFERIANFWDKIEYVKQHISEIDRHIPFDHPAINRVIEKVQPEYLVLEFLSDDLSGLEQMLTVQRSVLKDC